jgi:8-hydroxy-5-deazaflavin:NADPH oxidoreductase
MFMSGNDQEAKSVVKNFLETLGWKDILDLGGIEKARAQEMMMSMWLSLFGVLDTAHINIKAVR